MQSRTSKCVQVHCEFSYLHTGCVQNTNRGYCIRWMKLGAAHSVCLRTLLCMTGSKVAGNMAQSATATIGQRSMCDIYEYIILAITILLPSYVYRKPLYTAIRERLNQIGPSRSTSVDKWPEQNCTDSHVYSSTNVECDLVCRAITLKWVYALKTYWWA